MTIADTNNRMADVAVRLESPDQPDVRALLAQLDEYLSGLYPPESNHLLGIEELLQPNIRFLVARRGTQAFGCGALKLEKNGSAEVKRMYVDPASRGLGIGKALMRAIELEAKRASITVLRLETGIHQPEAIGLYIAGGFREIPAFPPYRPDPLSRFFAKQCALSD
jgi:putative acetyltransferase